MGISDKIKTKKKAVQLTGIDPKVLAQISNTGELQKAAIKGIAGDNILEPIPNFIKAPSEKVISNANNSWIVLGRDRPGPRSSGYGGKGDTQAGSIDIVVGRMADKVRTVDKATGEILWVDPDFKVDSARIYISQKTDLDENFGLISGKVGTSKARSGIAMKADGIRLVAREGIKLITSQATKNSVGGDIQSFLGVDIIAGNVDDKKTNSDLQPMPKGENLAEALQRLTKHVEDLNGIVDSILMTQMEFNTALTNHFHQSPFFAAPTSPSITLVPAGIRATVNHMAKAKMSLVTHKANLGMYKQTYLEQHGKKYINSRFNNVN